jgi:hypothetical protein
MPALARFGQNGPVEWATPAWAQTAQPLIEPPEPPALKLGDRDEDEMADVQCSSKKSGETPRASAASLRDAVPEAGRFPSHAARIGAGLSPLPHLRRRADPPLLACLLTRLAMRDRNLDTRPALRQQAVGGGGEPPASAGAPSALPEACYRRRPAARVRTRSARPQGERVLRAPNSSPPANSLGRFLLDAASTGSLAPFTNSLQTRLRAASGGRAFRTEVSVAVPPERVSDAQFKRKSV